MALSYDLLLHFVVHHSCLYYYIKVFCLFFKGYDVRILWPRLMTHACAVGAALTGRGNDRGPPCRALPVVIGHAPPPSGAEPMTGAVGRWWAVRDGLADLACDESADELDRSLSSLRRPTITKTGGINEVSPARSAAGVRSPAATSD